MQLQNLVETVREQLADPRRMSHGNIRHSLEAIVVIGLCTVMCGGEGFEAMELIGNARQSYFESLFIIAKVAEKRRTRGTTLHLLMMFQHLH